MGPPISRYSRSRLLGRLLYHVSKLVQIGSPLPSAGDLNETCRLQLLDEFADARLAHAHVFGEPLLPRKAAVIVPGVVQKHRIGDFSAEAEVAVFENEIWDLREP